MLVETTACYSKGSTCAAARRHCRTCGAKMIPRRCVRACKGSTQSLPAHRHRPATTHSARAHACTHLGYGNIDRIYMLLSAVAPSPPSSSTDGAAARTVVFHFFSTSAALYSRVVLVEEVLLRALLLLLPDTPPTTTLRAPPTVLPAHGPHRILAWSCNAANILPRLIFKKAKGDPSNKNQSWSWLNHERPGNSLYAS